MHLKTEILMSRLWTLFVGISTGFVVATINVFAYMKFIPIENILVSLGLPLLVYSFNGLITDSLGKAVIASFISIISTFFFFGLFFVTPALFLGGDSLLMVIGFISGVLMIFSTILWCLIGGIFGAILREFV